MLQIEAGFVSKHNVVPFRCPYAPFIVSLASKTPMVSIKGNRRNGRLTDIPLHYKRCRMVRVDTKRCVTD
ncbi:hypothetical protein TNCV_3521701 [Trichonephila clavipes]|nr:hypothetical protein TNCV_3521701 [Trichonephila clavipes]